MDKKNINEEQKKVLQAKHRLEEAEMRDRVKERKARVRRLIREGAVLESVAPAVKEMDDAQLKQALRSRLQGL